MSHDSGAHSLSPELWQPTLEVARRAYPARNKYGVLAFGIGPTIVEGRAQPCIGLNVYVVRKEREPRHPIAQVEVESGGKRWQVPVNVVGMGAPPVASRGRMPAFSGVHPGAAITTRRGGAFAAVCCLLGSRGQPTHAVTAGHLFRKGKAGAPVLAADKPRGLLRTVGHLQVNYLDSGDIDAALIRLTEAGVTMRNDSGPPLTDYLALQNCWGKQVRARLPTSGDYSPETQTALDGLDVLMTSHTRGRYWIRGAVSTVARVTQPGDSGTLLCSGLSNQFLVGVCAGSTGFHSVFEPFERVLIEIQKTNPELELITHT
jgi:hypothetical protein